MKFRLGWFGLFFMFLSLVVWAEASPVATLQQVSQKILSQLQQNQGHLNKESIARIVNTSLVPHVDLETMSRSVVGRDYWKQATPEQRQQFKHLFTRLVIST
jgi:ABC-type transporter MlaC component